MVAAAESIPPPFLGSPVRLPPAQPHTARPWLPLGPTRVWLLLEMVDHCLIHPGDVGGADGGAEFLVREVIQVQQRVDLLV